MLVDVAVGGMCVGVAVGGMWVGVAVGPVWVGSTWVGTLVVAMVVGWTLGWSNRRRLSWGVGHGGQTGWNEIGGIWGRVTGDAEIVVMAFACASLSSFFCPEVVGVIWNK